MKKFLIIAAAVFAVLAIIFYVVSIQEVKTGYGTIAIANIQATTFCAACAIICAINVVGAILFSYLETFEYRTGSSVSGTSGIQTSDGGFIPTAGNYWTCPKCKNRNPMSKVECRECGTIRS